MSESPAVFNHVGLCVTDLQRARAFYERALGFSYWWEMEPPDEGTAQLLQLDRPVGARAIYLVRDGLVLELLQFHPDRYRAAPPRTMAESGLTHISLSVSDLDEALALVERHGGSVVDGTNVGPAVMVRDPDGQLLELLTLAWRDALPPFPS